MCQFMGNAMRTERIGTYLGLGPPPSSLRYNFMNAHVHDLLFLHWTRQTFAH